MGFSIDKLKEKNNATAHLSVLSKKNGQNGLSIRKNSSLAQLTGKGITTSVSEAKQKKEQYMANMIDQTSAYLRENDVEYLFLIDKSASCKGTEDITSLGYSKMINKEKKSGFPTRVTTVLFDRERTILHFREDIQSVLPLRYKAYGGTFLYDAMIYSIQELKKNRIQNGDTPSKTVVAIMTDGLDQKKGRYQIEDARQIVLECKNEGWEFIFIGDLKNTETIASQLGITHYAGSENTVECIEAKFDSVSRALEDLRNYGKVRNNWSDKIKRTNIGTADVKKLELK